MDLQVLAVSGLSETDLDLTDLFAEPRSSIISLKAKYGPIIAQLGQDAIYNLDNPTLEEGSIRATWDKMVILRARAKRALLPQAAAYIDKALLMKLATLLGEKLAAVTGYVYAAIDPSPEAFLLGISEFSRLNPDIYAAAIRASVQTSNRHAVRSAGSSNPRQDRTRTCHFCKKEGHVNRRCRKYISAPRKKHRQLRRPLVQPHRRKRRPRRRHL